MAGGMQRYWDERAQEDPFYYVDSREALGAPDEEAFWAGGEQVIQKIFQDLGVALSGTEDVVEIGCGIGRLTRPLAHQARSVAALDVSEVMLEHARRYNPELENVEWIHGDGTTLAPLSDESADACISFVVFQHLPDPDLTYGYVREIGRVLRPGGWAALQVSNDPRVHERPSGWARLRELRRAVLRTGPRTQNAAWRGSSVEIDELRRVASDSGLDLEQVQNPGSLFCLVLARRVAPSPRPHAPPAGHTLSSGP
jgi:SAM-dependent methyltransferase